jgi:hypothetical protein
MRQGLLCRGHPCLARRHHLRATGRRRYQRRAVHGRVRREARLPVDDDSVTFVHTARYDREPAGIPLDDDGMLPRRVGAITTTHVRAALAGRRPVGITSALSCRTDATGRHN